MTFFKGYKEFIIMIMIQKRCVHYCVNKERKLPLPVDLQLYIYLTNKAVTLLILYGCEVRGFELCEIKGKLQLKRN